MVREPLIEVVFVLQQLAQLPLALLKPYVRDHVCDVAALIAASAQPSVGRLMALFHSVEQLTPSVSRGEGSAHLRSPFGVHLLAVSELSLRVARHVSCVVHELGESLVMLAECLKLFGQGGA